MVDGRIIIAGAGIGGLCLAHALERHGCDVLVLERAADPSSHGSGVVLFPKTTLLLREAGLGAVVTSEAQVVEQARVLNSKGRVLASMSSAQFEREFGAPCLAISGARLHAVLVEALGARTIRFGFRVATYEEDSERVTVISDDGRREKGAVLVGADGTWSRIRSRLVGDGPPSYAGYTSWRGVSEAGDLVRPGTTTESWGSGERFGIVSIGGGRAYWFALANAEAGERDDPDPIPKLRRRFEGWHAPIDELLRRTPRAHVFRADIHDRAPIRRWGDGRVVLMGDAAHPMTTDAHGAGQAIEDAVVLSRALLRHDAVIAAFREYEAARVDRASQLARWSRSYGEVAHWKGSLPRLLRDTALRLVPGSLSPFVVFGN